MSNTVQDIRELRESIEQLREKLSKDVLEAFISSRDLHQKQALLMAKIEVRVEAIEAQGKQLLGALQGDPAKPGVISQVDLLKVKVSDLVEAVKAVEVKQAAVESEVALCKSKATLVPEQRSEIELLKKEITILQTRDAKVQGGWYAGGVIVTGLISVLALVSTLYQAFF